MYNRIAWGGIIRQKYRENFIKYDKNIARILSNTTKISREFYLICNKELSIYNLF